MEENQVFAPQKNNLDVRKWLLYLLGGVLILAGFFVVGLYYYEKNNRQEEIQAPIEVKKEASPLDEIIPQESSSPEDFLEKVNTKSKELQKEYDSSLLTIAQKKWENIFRSSSGLPPEYISSHIEILDQNVVRDPDQSNLYKIRYLIKVSWAQAEVNDYFFLILSPEKAQSLGFQELKANNFFSEKEITENLGKDGFGQVTKIKPTEDVVFSSFEDSIKALEEFSNAKCQDIHIVAGSEKILKNKGITDGDLYVLGSFQTEGKCQIAYISLFDKNLRGFADCQN